MELAEVVGQLAGLRRFPVRSLGGESPDECIVEASTLAGDRLYDLYDEADRSLVSSREAPVLLRYRARYLDALVRGVDLSAWIRVKMPGGVEVPLVDAAWIDDIARRRGKAMSLRARTDSASDPAPLHVISVATVRFIEKQYGGPIEPMRIRANLLLDLPEARPFEEDRWIGRQVWVGDALLEIVSPCERAIVPTLDAETPERSPGLLSAILRARGGMIGVSARALTGTRLRVGDPVALVD